MLFRIRSLPSGSSPVAPELPPRYLIATPHPRLGREFRAHPTRSDAEVPDGLGEAGGRQVGKALWSGRDHAARWGCSHQAFTRPRVPRASRAAEHRRKSSRQEADAHKEANEEACAAYRDSGEAFADAGPSLEISAEHRHRPSGSFRQTVMYLPAAVRRVPVESGAVIRFVP